VLGEQALARRTRAQVRGAAQLARSVQCWSARVEQQHDAGGAHVSRASGWRRRRSMDVRAAGGSAGVWARGSWRRWSGLGTGGAERGIGCAELGRRGRCGAEVARHRAPTQGPGALLPRINDGDLLCRRAAAAHARRGPRTRTARACADGAEARQLGADPPRGQRGRAQRWSGAGEPRSSRRQRGRVWRGKLGRSSCTAARRSGQK
jgi:hypothetical protein